MKEDRTDLPADMNGLMADVGGVIAAQADVHFTDERLAKQRTRILERLEEEARHGRVITFPTAHASAPALRSRPGMRWIAAAAAAGLLIGFVADHLAHRMPARPAPSALTAVGAQDALQLVAVPLSEEELLGRLELAVEGTAGSALRSLDDLTPHVWEAATR